MNAGQATTTTLKKSGTDHVKPPPAAAAEQTRSHTITDSGDAAALRRDVKDFYLNTVGANVVAVQMRPLVSYGDDGGQSARKCAETFVAAIKESVQPRDAIEEMLVLQMAWTHARLGVLSSVKANQEGLQALRALNDACDRAAGTFRKQMLALTEYRRPPRTDSFVAIKLANLANQQVINNDQIERSAKSVPSNELGSAPNQALPPHAEGLDLATAGSPAKQALGIEHRPKNEAGEDPSQQERPEARGAERRTNCGLAGNQ